MSEYQEFLKRKARTVTCRGVPEPYRLPEMLFGFQRDATAWALRKGRAALWLDCGMGKTACLLTWAHEVARHTGEHVLILAPLAVSQQTRSEGEKFGLPVQVVRDQSQVESRVIITNYEMLEHMDPSAYGGIVLDESGILKAIGGKTRAYITEAFSGTPFRLACTATPAPNDYMELGNHSEFLGVLSRSEMLSEFFVHDGGETQKWRLKGHAEAEFWKWICEWAVAMRRPSDLGYEDDGFILPPLSIIHHVTDNDDAAAQAAGKLFAMDAHTLDERRAARRGSMDERVRVAAALVNASSEQWLVWCDFNAEGDALTKAINGAVQVSGSDSTDDKIDRLIGFTEGRYRTLVSKASIFGYGMNLQCCHNMIFCGLSDSYERFYQAVRRCWRFGQRDEVAVHVITSGAEGAVVKNIQRKEAAAQGMANAMIKHMATRSAEALRGREISVALEHTHESEVGENWRVYLGDCIEVAREIPSDSIHYSVFSPPFSSLYVYSSSERDLGNTRTDEEFAEHFGFLIHELYRVIMPGRLCSVHCMNLPTSKIREGVIGLRDFRGEIIRAFVSAGWIFHSEVCIWKDPVVQMQRTKALGLLHKQLKKDSCMSRQGIPDYVVTFKKPGDNPERVTHTNESFPVSVWQRYASPIWMDINATRTLQRDSAREEKDERHVCPLQLDVIERCVDLWTNSGDVVLSPFAGIGSEGVVAVERGRKFVGVELKRSYWQQAVANLRLAEERIASQGNLFDSPRELQPAAVAPPVDEGGSSAT